MIKSLLLESCGTLLAWAVLYTLVWFFCPRKFPKKFASIPLELWIAIFFVSSAPPRNVILTYPQLGGWLPGFLISLIFMTIGYFIAIPLARRLSSPIAPRPALPNSATE